MNPYMYLFVREDLSKPQQIVQVAHAVEDANFQKSEKTNYMVLISVQNETKLLEVSEHLFFNGVEHNMFFEPDLNSHTAIATKPLVGKERKLMQKYQLMK